MNTTGELIDATPCAYVDLDVPVDPNEKIGLTQSQTTKKAELRIFFDKMNTERDVREFTDIVNCWGAIFLLS